MQQTADLPPEEGAALVNRLLAVMVTPPPATDRLEEHKN